ncbi:MAG: galactose-1-phosphate uridylyltransferase [candidate division Zixibacteria bacterium]|nr:galactose-1-phosphate uridylyltransferase [candidate division Zixibacteria bacterium]
MPEFRQNQATKEWVILAPERGLRPSDYKKERAKPERVSAYSESCPFCAGNEDQTEQAVLTLPASDGWRVRVVPNKYAALQPQLATTRTWVGSFLSAKGFGVAEVVIEHPQHNQTPALMELIEVTDVLRAYRERQIEISRNEKINLVTIFRNHGQQAGTSLEHPHSQIIATPIVPPHVRYPMEQAVLHYDKLGSCVYCDTVTEELRQGERIIIETENFAAFCPFAARSPFECRIYPRKHQASFMLVGDDDIIELADVLRTVLNKLYHGLNNPDYNYIIRSSPIGDEDTRHLHWYIVIIPIISIRAGFEIGSGIYINTVAPEEAARYLREIRFVS